MSALSQKIIPVTYFAPTTWAFHKYRAPSWAEEGTEPAQKIT